MKNLHRPSFRPLVLLALLLAGLALSGCAGRLARPDPDGLEREAGTYRAAVRLYEAGESEAARQRFQQLSETAGDPSLRASSRIALAGIELAEADTPEELDAAKEAWKKAVGTADAGTGRDAAMLAPLAPLIDRFQLPAPDQNLAKPKIVLAPPRRKCPEQDKLDAANEQLAECRKQRAAQDKRVKQLQDQMKALESIHKEILDKKKEMSGPK